LNELCGIAINRLHLSPDEFYSLTPLEFDYALKDFNDQSQFKLRYEAELMRLQTAYLININLEEKNQFDDPRKLMRFPWESENKNEEQSEPNWEALEREIKGVN
jgi:hypothetical protein